MPWGNPVRAAQAAVSWVGNQASRVLSSPPSPPAPPSGGFQLAPSHANSTPQTILPQQAFSAVDRQFRQSSIVCISGTCPTTAGASAPPSAAPVNGTLTLGKNSIYEEDIKFAAARAGLSPPAVAALIDAEAAKINGVWDPNSKNPRSSALGITQFLRGTWLEQAEKKGTYLNDHAHASGYLDAAGKVKQQDQETVLDLRRNPRFAIVAATDYANANLTSLSRAGLLPQDMTDSERAKIMYLTHHLGPGDVRGFLTRQIPEERAKTLLTAQVGEPAADSRRAMDQSWVQAHRSWLTSFVESSVDIRKFTKDGVSTSQGRNVEEMSNR